MPAAVADQNEMVTSSNVVTSTNVTLDSIDIPGEKKLKQGGGEGANTPSAAPPKVVVPGTTPIYSIIQTGNPISALYEYCKKGTLRSEFIFVLNS